MGVWIVRIDKLYPKDQSCLITDGPYSDLNYATNSISITFKRKKIIIKIIELKSDDFRKSMDIAKDTSWICMQNRSVRYL